MLTGFRSASRGAVVAALVARYTPHPTPPLNPHLNTGSKSLWVSDYGTRNSLQMKRASSEFLCARTLLLYLSLCVPIEHCYYVPT